MEYSITHLDTDTTVLTTTSKAKVLEYLSRCPAYLYSVAEHDMEHVDTYGVGDIEQLNGEEWLRENE